MTISPFAPGLYAARGASDVFVSARRDLDDLQRQLASGLKATSYGGLGFERRTSLDLRGRMSALDGYGAAIDQAQFRVKVMMQGVQQLAASAREAWSDLQPPRFDPGPDGRTSAQNTAEQRLSLAIDVLNSDVSGRYLFAGRAVDKPPVESLDRIMNGDAALGQAGLKQLIAERKEADLGPGATKLGRLGLDYAGGTSVSLGEDASPETRANFGFMIKGGSSSNPAAIAVTNTAGAPASVALSFAGQPAEGGIVRVAVNRADGHQDLLEFTARANPAPGSATEFAIGSSAAASAANLQAKLAGPPALEIASAQSGNPPGVSAAFSGGTAASAAFNVAMQPADGDVVRITVALRDGTRETIELTAKTSADPASTKQFAIGATPAATAAALASALGRAVDEKASTALAGVSTKLTADDFFAGSMTPGREPRRIGGGSPFTGATGFANLAAGRTLIWYKGDDTAPSARGTAPVQTDKLQSVGAGAQANEPGIRAALAQFAALAGESFANTPTDQIRQEVLAAKTQLTLAPTGSAGTIEHIGEELGQAAATMNQAKERHDATKAMLQTSIDDVENAKPEEVGAQMLALQTRLQASYQTTSMLSRLSLVNYL